MNRRIEFLSAPVRLGAVAIMAAAGLASPQAQAGVQPPGYAVLYTGEPHNLDFSNSNVTGNIGIADDGGFVGSGSGSVIGTVQFSAANHGQFAPNGITVTGGATFGNANVQTDLNTLNATSQSLRNEGGTPELIAAGGSVNASAGIMDPNGNQVFTATIASNFTAGTTFTINGTSSQFVVFNTVTGGLPFNGSIVLTGGITSDHVLFNFDAGNFNTSSGGDPLLMNTNGNTTTGTYLDPNGDFQITNTILDGRIFGGDTLDSGITNSTIVAPVVVPAPPIGHGLPVLLTVGGILLGARLLERGRKRRLRGTAPKPASLALLGAGLVEFGITRQRHRLLPGRS
jgi:hypothetical protein